MVRACVGLRTGRPTERVIHTAVRTVLAEPSFRAHAQRLGAAYQRTDAGTRAAEEIEALVGTEETTPAHGRELLEERR